MTTTSGDPRNLNHFLEGSGPLPQTGQDPLKVGVYLDRGAGGSMIIQVTAFSEDNKPYGDGSATVSIDEGRWRTMASESDPWPVPPFPRRRRRRIFNPRFDRSPGRWTEEQ